MKIFQKIVNIGTLKQLLEDDSLFLKEILKLLIEIQTNEQKATNEFPSQVHFDMNIISSLILFWRFRIAQNKNSKITLDLDNYYLITSLRIIEIYSQRIDRNYFGEQITSEILYQIVNDALQISPKSKVFSKKLLDTFKYENNN